MAGIGEGTGTPIATPTAVSATATTLIKESRGREALPYILLSNNALNCARITHAITPLSFIYRV